MALNETELIHLALSFKTLLLTKNHNKEWKTKQKLKDKENKKEGSNYIFKFRVQEASDNWFRRPKKIRKAKKSNPMYVTESAKDSCIGCASTPRVIGEGGTENRKLRWKFEPHEWTEVLKDLELGFCVFVFAPPEPGFWPSSNPGTQQGEF